jgi:hypothetical protein
MTDTEAADSRTVHRRPSRSIPLDLAALAAARIRLGLSYAELGCQLVTASHPKGYSGEHVSLVERGRQGASPEYARALAKRLLGRESKLPELLAKNGDSTP